MDAWLDRPFQRILNPNLRSRMSPVPQYYPKYLKSNMPPDPWGQTITETVWSPELAQQQIELLIQTNNKDMDMQLLHQRTKSKQTHRKCRGELRLLGSCLLGQGQVVFDFRVREDMLKRGEKPPPLCVGQLDEAVVVGSKWNVAEVVQSCNRAGVQDAYRVQQLTATGLFSHFDQDRLQDLMLMQNGSGAS